MSEVKGGGVLGERSIARCRSFGVTAVTGEGCRQSHIRALNRHDGDKRMNAPPMMLLVVPHVRLTANYHILLWAHHCETTEGRAWLQHRNSPKVYTPKRKIWRTKCQVEPPIRNERQTGRKNHAGDGEEDNEK